MDFVKFNHDSRELVVTNNLPNRCEVIVKTTLSKINLTLELGDDCFFKALDGTRKQSQKWIFKPVGYNKPTVCELDLHITTQDEGDVICILSASTDHSNLAEIRLIIHKNDNDFSS